MKEEYKIYLEEIVSKEYEDIKYLIEEINAVNNCTFCDENKFLDGVCQFCGKENTELKNLNKTLNLRINRIYRQLQNLPIKQFPINKLFNLLYTLNIKENKLVNELLKKYEYDNLINDYFKELYQNFLCHKNKPVGLYLDDLDINVIETLIKRNESNFNYNHLFNLVMYKTFSEDNKNINYEYFKLLITNQIERLIEKYINYSDCQIKNLNDENEDNIKMIYGTANASTISIEEDLIYMAYFHGETKIIETIFHELMHVRQFERYTNKKLTEYNKFFLNGLKDFILFKNLPNYAVENYDNLIYEIEAYKYGFIKSNSYLNDIGIPTKINKEYYNHKIEEFNSQLYNNKRRINGNEVCLDNEFEKIIYNKPELLNYYPILKLLYKEEEKKLILKSYEEMMYEKNNILNNSEYSYEEKECYQKFYNDIFKNMWRGR